MKKTISFAVFVVVAFLSFKVYALDVNPLVKTRDNFFEESKALKALITTDSRDMIFVNTLWDSCIMTVNQLDAYFFMVGIFNTIKETSSSGAAVDYLSNWLVGIKKVNLLNLKSLEDVPGTIAPKTKLKLDRLRDYLNVLNTQIDGELNKIFSLKKSLTKKSK